jgi:hypothetical protein
MKNKSRTTKKTRKHRKRVLGGTDEVQSPPTEKVRPKHPSRDNGRIDDAIHAANLNLNYLGNKVETAVLQAKWSSNEKQFCFAFFNLYKKFRDIIHSLYPKDQRILAPKLSLAPHLVGTGLQVLHHFGISDFDVEDQGWDEESNKKETQISWFCNYKDRTRRYNMRDHVQHWKDIYNNAEKTRGGERFIKIADWRKVDIWGDPTTDVFGNTYKITVKIDNIYTQDILLDLANLDSLLTKRSKESASPDKNNICVAKSKLIDTYLSIINRHPNKTDLLNFFSVLKDSFYENGKLDMAVGHLKSADHYKNGCPDLDSQQLDLIYQTIKDITLTAPVEEEEGPNKGKRYIKRTGIRGMLNNKLYLDDVFPETEFEHIEDDLNSGFVDVGFGGRKTRKTKGNNKKQSIARKHK